MINSILEQDLSCSEIIQKLAKNEYKITYSEIQEYLYMSGDKLVVFFNLQDKKNDFEIYFNATYKFTREKPETDFFILNGKKEARILLEKNNAYLIEEAEPYISFHKWLDEEDVSYYDKIEHLTDAEYTKLANYINNLAGINNKELHEKILNGYLANEARIKEREQLLLKTLETVSEKTYNDKNKIKAIDRLNDLIYKISGNHVNFTDPVKTYIKAKITDGTFVNDSFCYLDVIEENYQDTYLKILLRELSDVTDTIIEDIEDANTIRSDYFELR